ncbi:hypothetical protein [Gemmatimonas sp.]|uniref:hypothetical protein n=1 Tax=Gemmatimonas sp. TaxID=1962908 RepID=UPI0025BD4E20|nr:hypothetical protein [Gemmatimonas sp.]MCA2991164.1 hypothetical protein [Gemmatimonas sp.]
MQPLFTRQSLSEWLDKRSKAVAEQVERIPEKRLLETPTEDLVDEVVASMVVDPLVIRRDERSVDATPGKMDASRLPDRDVWPGQGPVFVPATVVTASVPFDGFDDLLEFRTSTFTGTLPRGRVVQKTIKLIGLQPALEGNEPPGTDLAAVEAITRWIDRHLSLLENYARWSGEQVRQYNTALPGSVRREVDARKGRVLSRHRLQASLGVPLAARADSPITLSVEGVRRKPPIVPAAVAPSHPTTTSSVAPLFVPEYALTDEQYAEVLKVIRAMGRSMEQTPQAFAELGEEDLRAVLLAALNATFEGGATAETFNCKGKADILVRHAGQNVFVGECKVWKGPKSLTDALDQVLDYVTWRDSKAAVVLFVHRGDMGAITASIPTVLESYEFTKRRTDVAGGEWRWTLRHRHDDTREVTVAVMTFNLPRTISRTGARRGRRSPGRTITETP